MTDDTPNIRRRLATGDLLDGDLSWCNQRIKALRAWPESLNEKQEQELKELIGYVERHTVP